MLWHLRAKGAAVGKGGSGCCDIFVQRVYLWIGWQVEGAMTFAHLRMRARGAAVSGQVVSAMKLCLKGAAVGRQEASAMTLVGHHSFGVQL